MTTMHLQTQKPLTRSESFQRMLDLEKRYKLARLQSTQILTAAETSLPTRPRISKHPTDIRPHSPTRSKLLAQDHGDDVPNSPNQTDSLPPLSISIPASTGTRENTRIHSEQGMVTHATIPAGDENTDPLGSTDNAVAQERTASLSSNRDVSGDNESENHEDDELSDQSSICQSPSWEGYDQKKKNKKKQQLADHRRKESERIEQSREATAKKRSSNRLFKLQPGENTNLAKPRKRSTSSTASVSLEPDSTPAVKAEKGKSPCHQAYGQDVLEIFAGFDSSYLDVNLEKTPPSMPMSRQGSRATGAAQLPEITLSSNEKMSYPPPSSRSHILRNVVPPSHGRRNSASAVSSESDLFQVRNTKSNQDHQLDGSLSDQPVGRTAEVVSRGRQSTGSLQTGSYVRKARAQSMERSIKGFMLETALSGPSPPTQEDSASLSYLKKLRQRPPLSVYQRPSSAQSAHVVHTGPSHGIAEQKNDAPIANAGKNTFQLDEVNRSPGEREHGQEQQQPENDNSQPSHATGILNHHVKNRNSGTKSSSASDLATPTAGIFSSLKSRMSRRGSTSGGSLTGNTGRSFKERAMGAMHLPSNSTMALCGKSAAGKCPENSSQTTIASTMSAVGNNAAGRSLSSLSRNDQKQLPKPARFLGELNAETMSQGLQAKSRSRPSEGSSASSYHESSSAPVSIASTPDTSRPQSAKGSHAAVRESQLGNAGVSMPQQDVVASALEPYLAVDSSSTPKNSNASQGKAEKGHPSRSELQQSDRKEERPLASSAVDNPASRRTCPREGSDNHGRLLQDAMLVSASIPENEPPRELQPSATEGTNLSCAPSESLSRGLGIVHGPCAQSTTGPIADAGSIILSAPKREKHIFSSHVKHGPASGKAQRGLSDCTEQAETCKKVATFPSVPTSANAVLLDLNEASAPSQQPKDQSSETKGADADGASPVKGATGAKSVNTTTPVHYVSHGRGHSTGAMYLQEVRRSAPLISSPLSSVIRNTAKLSSNRSGGGSSINGSTPSLGSAGRTFPSPTMSQFRLPEPAHEAQQVDGVRGSSASISSSSVSLSSSNISLSSGSGSRKKMAALPQLQPQPQPSAPLAKMLVECCRCKFLHDMPSRVYECMAQPDAVVTDRDLGVSGAITTMVKCPWCSHNMRTQCCAGYAAVVYLKERLH